MIDKLIEVLQQQKLLLIEASSEAIPIIQDEDIADALWLASKIGGARKLTDAKPEEALEDTDEPLPSRVIDAVAPPPVAMPSVPAVMPLATEQAQDTATEVPEQGLPIQVQAAPALPERREIARALRPLMRKVPSRTRSVLDEQATVNRIAESGIWQLAFKPALERWFDLELVIEASEFSFVWQETLDEFRQLLERQGAFRNVRTWHMDGAQTGRPRLVAKARQLSANETTQLARSERELVDVSGRRLVLYVSDCRSPLWRQGKVHDWLRLWGEYGPTAVVQLLPERLWPASELDVGYAVQVGSLVPGALNKKLQIRELSPLVEEIDEVSSLTLPVVTLTAAALKQWALVVAAAGRQRAPARLFDMDWVKNDEREAATEVTRPASAEARVELFEATASPAAQQLASRMAAVPVEMPVVHLIQEILRPSLTITPVHIAEVYDSSLLIAKNSDPGGEQRHYDFWPGVRTCIIRKTPLDETIGTVEALSQQIAKTLGFNIKSFTALLSPKSDWTEDQKEAVLPFAQVTTAVLRHLGGNYAALAQLVESDAQKRSDWIKPVEEAIQEPAEGIFSKLESFDFTEAQLVEDTDADFLPLLQTEEFTVVTFSTFERPEGVIPLRSSLYLERPPIESDCYSEIVKPGALIRVKAARQMGKSSLMSRILDYGSNQGFRSVLINFQEADSEVFDDLEKFLRWFCIIIVEELELDISIDRIWQSNTLGNKRKCTNFFQKHLLPQIKTPLLLGLDEVDLVFQNLKIAQDFFALLRTWHERGKNQTTWQNLRLVILHSREMYVPLDMRQSPFNVGMPMELPEFKVTQVAELAQRHKLALSNKEIDDLFAMVGGHPYLVRVALYELMKASIDMSQLLQVAPTENGPYVDHLRRHWNNLNADEQLVKAMQKVINSVSPVVVESKVAFQLNSMGLIKYQSGLIKPLCDLYRLYFRYRL